MRWVWHAYVPLKRWDTVIKTRWRIRFWFLHQKQLILLKIHTRICVLVACYVFPAVRGFLGSSTGGAWGGSSARSLQEYIFFPVQNLSSDCHLVSHIDYRPTTTLPLCKNKLDKDCLPLILKLKVSKENPISGSVAALASLSAPNASR